MKKEYVKPQNRVVFLKDSLLQGAIGVSGTQDDESKIHFDDDESSDSYSDDIWED